MPSVQSLLSVQLSQFTTQTWIEFKRCAFYKAQCVWFLSDMRSLKKCWEVKIGCSSPSQSRQAMIMFMREGIFIGATSTACCLENSWKTKITWIGNEKKIFNPIHHLKVNYPFQISYCWTQVLCKLQNYPQKESLEKITVPHQIRT